MHKPCQRSSSCLTARRLPPPPVMPASPHTGHCLFWPTEMPSSSPSFSRLTFRPGGGGIASFFLPSPGLLHQIERHLGQSEKSLGSPPSGFFSRLSPFFKQGLFSFLSVWDLPPLPWVPSFFLFAGMSGFVIIMPPFCPGNKFPTPPYYQAQSPLSLR